MMTKDELQGNNVLDVAISIFCRIMPIKTTDQATMETPNNGGTGVGLAATA